MAGYDKYHDELVMVPKGSVGRVTGAGDISAKGNKGLSKAEFNTAMKEFEAKGGNVQKIEPNEATGRAGASGKGLSPSDLVKQSKKKPDLEWYETRMAKGGSVKSSASSRADGCAVRGKTKGKVV